ncbi:MAG TPA: pyridoxal 5'-phosphate synthase glutaminase subunit PdxT [Dehalococcoidia bacterium]|nr:pyridoxal 5'-phosphate synthase glutaminase subunit PdxT [SAR202 cluster bacterium]HAC18906.1 pyridoxal 5'-phosphate synthase glutaminase subunit PdxT [Dehalococcoidia bacterium]HBJ30689.1 pyridoxal 5'-phosphate synthase glutaminase subunit PdxT [Dehalococcoidia bacterium]HHZ62902.1 pyridoxal 5'-phosphate synthase glutaminase subunit PdxT [Dehalococcoidia bacterium]HIM89606.1 pyridoxal 5'-phosphate synthase glutaminase subunit PdxT [Dehalococcoidia bacterium]
MTTVGVLAIQGDYREHRTLLESLGADVKEIRLPDQLDEVDGLIIPGGESTTIVQLIDIYNMREKLRERVLNEGMPTWGTCAGMIVMAQKLSDHRPDPLKLMNIEVSRNAFGRQVDSFETDLEVEDMDGPPYHAVFIRAPVVDTIGEGVRIISSLDDGRPVAVRQGHMLATAFHPELTNDPRMHKLFLQMVDEAG